MYEFIGKVVVSWFILKTIITVYDAMEENKTLKQTLKQGYM